jgi:catechol 2,3-dioxygenase-like lactoylglutathione lyase family enzyme
MSVASSAQEQTSIVIYIWEVPVPARIQLALNVDDLGESIAFYSKLFGNGPAKVKPGYANFAIAEPPLKLVLLENPGQGGSLNHLGVEVTDTDAVEAEQARLAEAGLAAVEERDTTCCYARQDKFWVKGAPNGERWEIYTVLDDTPTFWGQEGSQGWDAAAAELDDTHATAAAGDAASVQCCDTSQAEESAAAGGACC